MGGRGSWSATAETFSPDPGGSGGKGMPENVLGPMVPSSLAEALGSKGAPMSPMEASKGTNPHYNAAYDAYSSNCQRCVLAYEARRRGYDVTALPTYSGDLLPYGGDYLKALSSPSPVDVGKSAARVRNEVLSYGSGARAMIQVRSGRNGHVFIAENIGGRVAYIDPQTNKRYSNLSLSHVSSATVVRIDNQQFTDYARNAFTTQKV